MNERVVLVLVFFFAFASSAYALEVCPFQGKIDLSNKTLNVTVGTEQHSSLSFQVTLSSDKSFQLNLILEHLKTSLFEISTQLESSLRLVERENEESPVWLGKLVSHYSLLNSKPIDELTANFEIRNHTLFFPAIATGSVKINGFIELFSPYKLNFSLLLNGLPMKDFLSLWVDHLTSQTQGRVFGRIQISGIPKRLSLKGSLNSHEGVVDELEYDSIVLNVEGQYPIITLTDSTISKTDGMVFNIDGDFNLGNKEHYDDEIRTLTKSPLISQNEDQYEWTIKRNNNSDTSMSELKSFLREHETRDTPMKEDPDILGVEQEIRF